MANSDLSLLKLRRGTLEEKLTLFEKYLNAFATTTEKNRAQVIELAERLSQFQTVLDEFDSVQIAIDCLSQHESDKQINAREEFENKFHFLLAKAKSLFEGHNQNDDAKSSSSDESKSSRHNNISRSGDIQGVILPEIKVPKFNGSYDTWLEFRDLFKSLIHDSKRLSDIQKYHYLRGALIESAPQVIQSIEFVGKNYMTAWNTLCDRFNNTNILVNNHLRAIFNMENITIASATKIRYLYENLYKHLSCLKQLGEPIDYWDTLLIFIIANKLDKQSAQEWERHKLNCSSVNLETFKNFLKNRAYMLETVDLNFPKYEKHDNTRKYGNQSQYKKNENYSKSLASTSEHSNEDTYVKSHCNFNKPKHLECYFCHGKHMLFYCQEFLKLSVQDRYVKIKSLKLCENCLKPTHQDVSKCNWSGCKICGLKHNSVLHENSIQGEKQSNSNEENSTANKTNCILATAQNTILSTAQVKVHNPNTHSRLTVRALLDCGSQSSFITTRLCEKLKLQKTQCKLAVSGISENISYAKYKCDITIKSKDESHTFDLACFVLDNITSDLPDFSIDLNNLQIPIDINLADEEFYISQPIDILIGADAFWQLLTVGQMNVGLNAPILQNTRLGWIVAGPIASTKNPFLNKTSCNLSRDVSIIQEQLSKFWEIEEIESGKSNFSVEEQQCENYFIENTRTDETGRYIVSIPFKQSPSSLGESREIALKRFNSLEKRLSSDERLKTMYIEFLCEYEQLGHMTEVTNCANEKPEYFMPHHGVLKESSTSTKLRVVFNASAPTSNGLSLNQLQMTGPTIQQDILSIILRFRMHPIALASDIKMMYRQVLINPEQTKLQKILWRSNSNEPIKTYQLNTVTYGTTAASFLAIRCLFEIANECEKEHPLIAKIIKNSMYVDDLLTSVDSEEQAKYVYTTLSQVLLKRGFELRKWKSNHMNIIDSDIQSSSQSFDFTLNKDSKILGLSWCCDSDILTFTIQPPRLKNDQITKRTILSRIATIFDPLGLVSPCIILAKILLQKLWSEKHSWDDLLPKHIIDYWLDFSSDLHHLNDIEIPRKIICINPISITLHGFADASETSYGACVYIVSKNSENNIESNLLCAKSKVAPIKILTMPKLELCAALTLSRLIIKVIQSSDIQFDQIYCWSDSTIVLGWLKTTPNLLKPFVSHRVAEIQNSTQNFVWKHVPTMDNPADMVSRGLNPKLLLRSNAWFHGPSWLTLDINYWPKIHQEEADLPEKRKCMVIRNCQLAFPFERFSNLIRLKRVCAYVLRFIKNCKIKSQFKQKRDTSLSLTVDELNLSTNVLIKISQQQSFFEDFLSLKNGELPKTSKILSLHPFIDSADIIRVGGRLSNSDFPYDKKFPILLSPKHILTTLICESEHKTLMHAGPQLLLSTLRETYWIISGRNCVRKTVRNCVKCSRYDIKNKIQPLMGSLPSARTRPASPFTIVGVDYAGPFTMKDKPGRGCKPIKCWVALFVCFTTRAIHLELVLSLTSDSFLQALHRFIGRRGKPSEIFSDNATNSVKTNKDLQQMSDFLKTNESNIAEFASNLGIKWHFIPANSPHFGGIWEAGIQSLKRHLRRVMGNQVLFFFNFQTLLIRIEAVLNSRPLFPLTSDPSDLSALSPSHFLIGKHMTSLVEPSVDHLKENRLSQYQMLQKLYEHFWSRWSREYIAELQQRSKWKKNLSQLEQGQLVLIQDDNLPPSKWRLGRILKLVYGKDNIARVASIRTADGIVTRAIIRLCPLPVPVCQYLPRPGVCSGVEENNSPSLCTGAT